MRLLLALLLLGNICQAQIVGAPRRAKMPTATPSAEIDPTVPPAAKMLMESDLAKWNAAFSWGNHALQGYLKSVSWADVQGRPNTLSGFNITDAYPLNGNPANFLTDINSQQVTQALGFTPYDASNPNSYLTTITNTQIINALGFTPINPNGTAQQYVNGAGFKVPFPVIPAEQVNSDWNAVNGKSQILNKPLIPAPQVNADWNSVSGLSQVLNKPTIPAAQVSSDWNSNSGVSQILNKPVIPSVAFVYDSLSSVRTSLNAKLSPARTITINGVTQDLSANRTWTINIPTVPTNTSQISELTNLYYTDARARAALSAGTGISYNPTTGVISSTVSGSTPTYNNAPARPVNSTAFQISATKPTRVSYAVTHSIALTLLLSSGSSSVFLEISPNGTTGWITINQAGFSDAVAVAVALTKTVTNNVQGEVPAGFFCRLRTVTSGAGSASFVSGQEVTY